MCGFRIKEDSKGRTVVFEKSGEGLKDFSEIVEEFEAKKPQQQENMNSRSQDEREETDIDVEEGHSVLIFLETNNLAKLTLEDIRCFAKIIRDKLPSELISELITNLESGALNPK